MIYKKDNQAVGSLNLSHSQDSWNGRTSLTLKVQNPNTLAHYIARSRAEFRFLNPWRAGTELSRFNKVNIMAADALAPYVARTSEAMILTM